jgi:site-specific DNA-methyltransferase (adenine-specific)
VRLILCDLPYGITACEWDNVIPFEPMWEAFKRIIKPRGAIVLTASGKFTYQLVMSNFEWFKYEWVWDKSHSGNFATARFKPLAITEYVLIFADSTPNYYPIMRRGIMRIKGGGGKCRINGLLPQKSVNDMYHPTNIIKVTPAAKRADGHPTQKSVVLFEYLIRTYTQPGDVVFDPCCGSATTAVAARQCNRNFICGDSSVEYVQVARERLAKPYTMPMFEEAEKQEQAQQMEMELV